MPHSENTPITGLDFNSMSLSKNITSSTETSYHIFIVWLNAQKLSKQIKYELSKIFKLLSSITIKWDHDRFNENMSRFYGRKLPSIKQKVEHCGIGDLQLFLVQDDTPDYKIIDTSSGPQYVNYTAFRAKELFRSWTGGGHKIHATNNNKETMRDLSLLVGSDKIDLLPKFDGTVLERDLSGTNGWESFDELFSVMNECLPYVVLRNFDNLHNGELTDKHGDVDFLVHSLDEARQIMNAQPTFNQKFRRHHTIIVGERVIPVDIRNVGDNYYDRHWEVDILKNRVREGKFYRPSEKDYYYSLVYHALVHKVVISPDYINTFNELRKNSSIDLADRFIPDKLSEELDIFLNEHRYRYTYPDDASVFYNLAFLRSSSRNADTSLKLWPPLRAKVQARPILLDAAQRCLQLLPSKVGMIVKEQYKKFNRKV